MDKFFDLLGQTIDVSDQAVFTLKYSGLHEEEGRKINMSDLLTATQRRLYGYLLFMIMVHPDQVDPKYKHSRMTCRDCFEPPLDLYGVDAIIDTKMLKNPHIILFPLGALDNGINPDIVTLKKKRRGNIFRMLHKKL